MNYTTTLSSKGQLVLPKALRVAHRLKPGTAFTIQEREDGFLLKPRVRTGKTWKSLIVIIPSKGLRLSIREMDEAVAAEARKHK